MGGLYNLVLGQNDMAGALVSALGEIAPFDPPRFRDAWVEHDGDLLLIRVHTRTGGGNRECWCDDGDHHCYAAANEAMTRHPWYVGDCDDEFDSTYADWYFLVDLAQVAPEIGRALVALAQAPVDQSDRWQAAIARITERTAGA